MKSFESFSPPSQSSTSRIQERRSVKAESSDFFSLYFQCAAIPNSAVRCISKVRICISKGCPKFVTTVVCSDWYIFAFGVAI